MAKATKVAATKKSQLPQGFRSVRAERAEYFYKPVPGTTIQGVLLRRCKKNGRYPGNYYQVRLTEPVLCDHKIGEGEYEQVEAPASEVISVDEKGGLKSLAEFADGAHEVFIACGEKRAIGNGQTAWDFEVGVKPMDPDQVPF